MIHFYVYILLINIISFNAMRKDKRFAKRKARRVPEKTLLAFALVGGSLGLFIGMYYFRHKTKHKVFYFGVPVLLLVNIITYYILSNLLLSYNLWYLTLVFYNEIVSLHKDTWSYVNVYLCHYYSVSNTVFYGILHPLLPRPSTLNTICCQRVPQYTIDHPTLLNPRRIFQAEVHYNEKGVQFSRRRMYTFLFLHYSVL